MSKEEIQNFIIWYLPAIVITNFVSGAFFFPEAGFIKFSARFHFFASHLGGVVCGAWLFCQCPKHDLNKWIWGVFGFGTHLYAIILYFGYLAFNQEIKRND